jgi:hypothetical protein
MDDAATAHKDGYVTHPVVDGAAQLLIAAEVTHCGLDRDVSKQELDLIQFATGEVAQPRASATKVMRSKFLYARSRGGLPDNLPQHLRRHPSSPEPAQSRR